MHKVRDILKDIITVRKYKDAYSIADFYIYVC